MNNWEVSKYLITAKKDVDSIMFINKNLTKIPLALRKEYVDRIRDNFYINCCVVVDDFLDKNKITNNHQSKKRTEWKESRPLIQDLYYERDKNSAHIDEDYRSKNYQSFSDLILEMKQQVKIILKECSSILPKELTIDFFPHDKILFRLINKIDSNEEININRSKYVDHKEGYAVGDITKPRNVAYDIKELRGLSEEEKKELAILVDAGFNFYESIQNLQDFYILVNDIHNLSLWTLNTKNRIEAYKQLNRIGIIDKFDRPQKIRVLSKEMVDQVYNLANCVWGYNLWNT